MTQVTHGRNSRHAGSALERMQRSLERGAALRTLGLRAPFGQRVLGCVDELRCLFGEDGGDFGIEIDAVVSQLVLLPDRRFLDRGDECASA